MKKVDFSNGKITQNILQTAMPMMVAQVLNLLYNIVDRIYIGRIPETGTAALGAVGLCYPFIILVTGFTNMYGLGGAPLFSMELGRKNNGKAGEIINTSFRLEVCTAAIIMALGELLASGMLRLFGATDAELVYSLPYLRIYLLGTAFTMISTGMNPFINAQGYSTIGMLTVASGALTNLVLDPLFIFALGMGVQGAAIATVISQLLSFVLALRFLLGKNNEYPLTIPRLGASAEKKKLFPQAADIISLGTTSFIMSVTNSLVSIACNNVLMRFGGAIYVSVLTIINSVRQILDTPIAAITDGSSPIISYNYGAGKRANVRKAIFVMTTMAMGYTALMWFVIEKWPAMLIGIFTADETLSQAVLRPLHLYFFAFIFQALQYSGQTVYKSLNKKKYAIFFSIFRKVVMVVPLTFALPYLFGMGTDGVFMAEPISNLIGGLACFTTMLLTIMPQLKDDKNN